MRPRDLDKSAKIRIRFYRRVRLCPGVSIPTIEEPLSPESLWNGKDNQLERALTCLNEFARTG